MDYAFYRLPDTAEYHYIEGESVGLSSLSGLEGKHGFVIAPFHATEDCPMVMIQTDKSEVADVDDSEIALGKPSSATYSSSYDVVDHRDDYHHDFELFHKLLDDEKLDKIVLSRRKDVTIKDVAETNFQGDSLKELFLRTCRKYPHQMIVLVSTSLSGTWLMATPEVLMSKAGDRWSTMALAGTMDKPGPWSDKNINEQNIVAWYIRNTLLKRCYLVNQKPMRTVMAANVYHLRTDFEFATCDNITDVLKDLFPTPAVCGMPKSDAMTTILYDESLDRRYYSGFCGPWDVDDMSSLFVSLRCMEIDDNAFHLYAGGGLLKESDEETEWKETEAKMKTMLSLLT